MSRPASSGGEMCEYLIAFFLPPLGVFLKRGCYADFWINICLTILGWLPGVIHAWWVISKHRQVAAQPAAATTTTYGTAGRY